MCPDRTVTDVPDCTGGAPAPPGGGCRPLRCLRRIIQVLLRRFIPLRCARPPTLPSPSRGEGRLWRYRGVWAARVASPQQRLRPFAQCWWQGRRTARFEVEMHAGLVETRNALAGLGEAQFVQHA
jgi:hypothetical protein